MKNFLFLLLFLTLAPLSNAASGGWILTTDYGTFGRVRGFLLEAPWSVTGDLAVIPGDPTGRYHEGLVYVVGRGGADLIQVYDPAAGFSLLREFSIGQGRNPQDIAFDAGGEAYVSCYDAAVLLKVDVTAGTVLETYDTSSFADADGLPETAWMLARQGRLYLAAQKLDRNNWYAPTGPGAILVFDTTVETWVDMDPLAAGVQPLALVGADPYTRMEAVDNGTDPWRLRVGCVGFYGVLDGGLEEVDPGAGVSLGYLVTEQDLGGDITAFVGSGESVHVLVSDASFITSLRRYDPADDTVAVLDTGNGYVHADLAWDGGFQIFVADRTLGAEGLRVFDAVSGAELTTGALATGLPPFQFVMPDFADISGVVTMPGSWLQLSPPWPNPCNPAAELRITGRAASRVQVGVYDLRGRRLVQQTVSTDGEGRAGFRFDGRDDHGRRLAAGVYRVVVQDDSGFAARTVTLLK